MKKILLVTGLAVAMFLSPLTTAYASGGNGGGGKTAPVVVPSNWPTNVPVPAGALQQVINTPPRIILQLIAPLGYTEEMQSIRTLYLSHGFIEPNPTTSPYAFTNGTYQVVIGGAGRDHSPTETTVNVYLDRI